MSCKCHPLGPSRGTLRSRSPRQPCGTFWNILGFRSVRVSARATFPRIPSSRVPSPPGRAPGSQVALGFLLSSRPAGTDGAQEGLGDPVWPRRDLRTAGCQGWHQPREGARGQLHPQGRASSPAGTGLTRDGDQNQGSWRAEAQAAGLSLRKENSNNNNNNPGCVKTLCSQPRPRARAWDGME